MIKKKLYIFFCLHLITSSYSNDQKSIIEPIFTEKSFPNDSINWVTGDEFEGVCEQIDDSLWKKCYGKKFDLYSRAQGPSGSARFWTITVGIKQKDDEKVKRGICFNTSTVGIKTLGSFNGPDICEDINQDGNPELCIWSSFKLHDDASHAEYGIMIWIYQITLKNMKIDWNLSRKMASEIAVEYRKPIDSENRILRQNRMKAADILESFATGKFPK